MFKKSEIHSIVLYLTATLYLIQEANKEVTEKKVANILDLFFNQNIFTN